MKLSDNDLRARFPRDWGYVASIRKRAARLVASAADDDALESGASKLGGAPDVPSSFAWPSHEDRPMVFVAQLRLSALAEFDDDALVPRDGLVLFFVDEGEEGAQRTSAGLGKGKVIRLAQDAKLTRCRSPESPSAPARALTLAETISLPIPPSPFVDLDSFHARERSVYEALLGELSPTRPAHQVLGYVGAPDPDGIQDGDTRLLLQVDLGEEGRARLAFFAQDAAMRRGELGSARAARFAL
jgi:hypothetical protein